MEISYRRRWELVDELNGKGLLPGKPVVELRQTEADVG